MKKVTLNLLVALLCLSIHAQNDATDCFEIKCAIKNYTEKIKETSVRITERGSFYKEYSTDNGKFELELPANSQYMLEFVSEGYFTKRIAISTEKAEDVEKVPLLLLTMSLVKKDSPFIMSRDYDLLDFPVAYMAFDAEAGVFYDRNKYYSEILLKGLNESEQNYFKESAIAYE